MTVSTTTIHQQLRTLLALTNTEIQIAETRQIQARTDAIRDELARNARDGRVRAERLEQALRERGGLVGVVRPGVGRAVAAVKSFAEQAQPLDEALLGDLALEQQIVGRAKYLKARATADSDTDLVKLADLLIAAHTDTVDWITTVLAEEALGGPAALRRSPTQWASGLAARAATLPAALAADGIDRTADALRSARQTLSGLRGRADEVSEDSAHEINGRVAAIGDTVVKVGSAAAQTVVAGRDAALDTIERNAREGGADRIADAVHEAREATGIVAPEDLPITGFDDLNATAAVDAVKGLDEPADIRTVLAYERNHKNRQSVVSASENRVAAIAKDVVGVQS